MKLNLAINELMRIKEDAELNANLYAKVGDEKQSAHCIEIAAHCHDAIRVLRIVQVTLSAGVTGRI